MQNCPIQRMSHCPCEEQTGVEPRPLQRKAFATRRSGLRKGLPASRHEASYRRLFPRDSDEHASNP